MRMCEHEGDEGECLSMSISVLVFRMEEAILPLKLLIVVHPDPICRLASMLTVLIVQ